MNVGNNVPFSAFHSQPGLIHCFVSMGSADTYARVYSVSFHNCKPHLKQRFGAPSQPRTADRGHSPGSNFTGATSNWFGIENLASVSIDATFSTQNLTLQKVLKIPCTHPNICNIFQKRFDPSSSKFCLKAPAEERWIHGNPAKMCNSFMLGKRLAHCFTSSRLMELMSCNSLTPGQVVLVTLFPG